jgi:predicted metal-dependent phosphoesterase TrpH
VKETGMRPAEWTIELHCHTYVSGDSLSAPARLLEVCRRRGIDRLAITDHNAVAGARAALALDPERIIPGEEIMTTQGELLAFFVGELVPAGLPPDEALRRLRDQGAFISVSHPFDHVRKGAWNLADLERILDRVDALEVFNARVLSAEPNRLAAELAERARLPGTSGSDAHTYAEVGRAAMVLPPFSDAESLRVSLRSARILRRRSSPLVHLASRYASWRKRLGWRPPGTPKR